MNKQDLPSFASLMLAMSEMYSKEISKFGIEMWVGDLDKYSLDQVKAGFKAHRADPKQGQFFPKPADIIRHIDGLPTENATIAWSKVIRSMYLHGAWDSVCFDDKHIHTAITNMGGWVSICGINNDEMPYKQKEFEKLYLAAEQNRFFIAPRYLVGHMELANHGAGYNCAPPIMIGDASKCKLILEEKHDDLPLLPHSIKSIGASI